MPTLKLISHKLCPYVQRARIVLEEKAVPHELEFIDLAAKPDWFLELSPLGRTPLLLVDGEPLFESAVIAEYVDEITPPSLLPADPLAKARHRGWIEFASSLLDTIGRYYSARDPQSFERARSDIAGKLQRLEQQLEGGPLFAGERFSLVDAASAPAFRYFEVFETIDGHDAFAATPKVAAWRAALAARPSVIAAAVPDYHARLRDFLAARDSVLGELTRGQRAA
jgi:glutathione S-transferase